MNELANTKERGASYLDGLAIQAQMFSCGAAMNMLQLGRVLTEAKPLVAHGEWMQWVRINAHLPVRTAQQYMQAYNEFGTDDRIAQLGTSRIIKLLPMSDEERKDLLEENDVAGMSTRALNEAIRARKPEAAQVGTLEAATLEKLKAEARAEARQAIEEAEEARYAAEKRAEELENREPEIPDEVIDELKHNRAEIERLSEAARDTLEDANKLRQERARLERDIQEQEDLLKEQQEALNRTQEELLNLQSAQARGDAAREPSGELTLGVFSAAVGEFMGLCARMPYMGASFATMPQKTKNAYDELLSTIEGWTQKAREALESYVLEEA